MTSKTSARVRVLSFFLWVTCARGFVVYPLIQPGDGSKKGLLLSSSSSSIPFSDALFPKEVYIRKKQTNIQRVYNTWDWKYRNRKYSINYRVEGQGPPILLIHGFGANLNHFRYQFPDLVNAGYKVYAMDLLGFGASEKPTNAHTVGFSIELFAQQMIDFMRSREEAEPWVLSGNSIGGLCSLLVASKADDMLPVKLSAVVLFNSAGGMTGFRYQDLPIWAHPIMGHTQYFLFGGFHGPFVYNTIARRDIIQLVLEQAGIYRDTKNVDDDLLEILLEPAGDTGAAQVFLSVFGGPAGPTREELLPLVQVPVLAFWGADDSFTPFDDNVKALPKLHGSDDFTLEVVESAGHCLHDEMPEVVNPKMIAFLKTRVNTTR